MTPGHWLIICQLSVTQPNEEEWVGGWVGWRGGGRPPIVLRTPSLLLGKCDVHETHSGSTNESHLHGKSFDAEINRKQRGGIIHNSGFDSSRDEMLPPCCSAPLLSHSLCSAMLFQLRTGFTQMRLGHFHRPHVNL